MHLINTILLTVGTLIIVSSLLYISIYTISIFIVEYKKRKSRKTIPTDINGVREVTYDVSSKVFKIHNKLKAYLIYAKFGLFLGLVLIVAPSMDFLVNGMFDKIPKLSKG